MQTGKADKAYQQLWHVVDGAVRDAFHKHQDYLTPKGRRSAKASILKRVTGTVLGFALQEAKRQRELAVTGASQDIEGRQAGALLEASAGVGDLTSSAPSIPKLRLGSVRIKPEVSRARHWGPVRRLRAAAHIEQTALLMSKYPAASRIASVPVAAQKGSA